MYKKTLSLLGVALALSAFASQAESERQASRERIVEQVLKPAARCRLSIPRRRLSGSRAGKQRQSGLLKSLPQSQVMNRW